MRPVATLLLAFFLLIRPAVAAQLPYLNLSLQTQTKTVFVNLVAEGWSEPPTQERARQALQEAFGVAPLGVEVEPLREWDEESDPDDESPPPTDAARKPAPITGFYLSARIPLTRSGQELTGQLQLAPLGQLFSTAPPERLRVLLSMTARDTGHAHCDGLPEVVQARRAALLNRKEFRAERALQSAPRITFSAGWSAAELARAMGLPLAVLLLPLLGTLLFRQRALQALTRLDNDAARRAVTTGYLRLLNHGTLLFAPIWVGITIAFRPLDPLRWFIGRPTPELGVLLGTLGVSGPLMLAHLLCALISLPVIRRLKDESLTFRDIFAETGGQYLMGYVPFLCFLLGVVTVFSGSASYLLPMLRYAPAEARALLLRDPNLQRAIGWFVASFVSRFLLPLLVGGRGITNQALLSGPLFDAVQRLAQQMRVPVRQVLYLHTGKSLIANAFAAQGNIVALTDHLVRSLTRAETDAVIAHELGHLKQKHANLLGWLQSPLALILALTLLVPRLPNAENLRWLYVPLVILGQSLLQLALSRRWERTADRLAAQLTGNPTALLTGLAKLARLNGSPESWSRWDESLLTHPSNRRRAENLVKAGLLTDAQAEAAFTALESVPDDPYPGPELTAEQIFSPSWRLQRSLRGLGMLLVLTAGAPLTVAWILERLTVPSPFLLAVLGIVALYLLYPLFLGVMTVDATTIARLRQSLIAEGKLAESDEGRFVSLMPGILPRTLLTGGSWDYGFLMVTDTALRFVGERRSFTLPRQAIEELTLVPGVPALKTIPAVLIRWGKGERAACRLQCYPARTIVPLAQELQRWHALGTPGPEPESLPVFPLLEGRTPRQATMPRHFFSNSWLFYLLIVGVWAFSGVARGQLLPILVPVTFVLLNEWIRGRRFSETLRPDQC